MGVREYLISGPLGFGAAPLGNMFRNIPDDEAAACVNAAWSEGTRYFDTAPFYGAGLSEIRLGNELAKHKGEEYCLSSKVGRIILDEVSQEVQSFGEKGNLFRYGRPNKIIFDYTEAGAMKSMEDSMKRLGVDRLDFVWIHDVARDFHGDGWIEQFEIAHRGAMVALTKLRDQKVIKAWGLGVNRVEPCELTIDMNETHPDAFLLAGRYTLLDHEQALNRLMPACAAKRVDIVVGGPYSSGVLVGGLHFEYAPAPPEILARVQKIKALCEEYSISIKAAALQFSLAHPASAAIIPGASKPERIAEDHAALNTSVPDEFWCELRKRNLVSPKAPLPIDRKKEERMMASANASIDLNASPDDVWKLIGGFGSLPDWMPEISKSSVTNGGRVRQIVNPDGQIFIEQLEKYDLARRTYSYSILQAPLPVVNYFATISVSAINGGKGSHVEWSGTFKPEGVSPDVAQNFFQRIFSGGLNALAARYSRTP